MAIYKLLPEVHTRLLDACIKSNRIKLVWVHTAVFTSDYVQNKDATTRALSIQSKLLVTSNYYKQSTTELTI